MVWCLSFLVLSGVSATGHQEADERCGRRDDDHAAEHHAEFAKVFAAFTATGVDGPGGARDHEADHTDAQADPLGPLQDGDEPFEARRGRRGAGIWHDATVSEVEDGGGGRSGGVGRNSAIIRVSFYSSE